MRLREPVDVLAYDAVPHHRRRTVGQVLLGQPAGQPVGGSGRLDGHMPAAGDGERALLPGKAVDLVAPHTG